MTRWPTWFESSVWTTPRTPATIAITIIPAALTETPRVSCASIATRTRAEQEGREHAQAGAHDDQSEQHRQPPPVRLEQPPDPAHVRAPHLRIGRPLGRRLSPVVEEHPHQRPTTNSGSRGIPLPLSDARRILVQGMADPDPKRLRAAAREARDDAAPFALVAAVILIALALVSRQAHWEVLGQSLWWMWLIVAAPYVFLRRRCSSA